MLLVCKDVNIRSYVANELTIPLNMSSADVLSVDAFFQRHMNPWITVWGLMTPMNYTLISLQCWASSC